MISYRQADLLGAVKAYGAKCSLKAHVGRSSDILPFRVTVDERSININMDMPNPEAVEEVRDFIKSILVNLGFDFLEVPKTFILDDLPSQAVAEQKYFDLFTAIKDSGRTSNASNKFTWLSGTRIKVFELSFVMS